MKKNRRNWWKEFLSNSDANVSTTAVMMAFVGFALAAPFALIAAILLILYGIIWQKPMDPTTASLVSHCLTIATGGVGVGMISRGIGSYMGRTPLGGGMQWKPPVRPKGE